MVNFFLGIIIGGMLGVLGMVYGNWLIRRQHIQENKDNKTVLHTSCPHHYVQVESSGKTLKQIVQNASLDWDFTDLIITEKCCDTHFKYKGRGFSVRYDYLVKIYIEVCIYCGECIDYQSFKLREIKDKMN